MILCLSCNLNDRNEAYIEFYNNHGIELCKELDFQLLDSIGKFTIYKNGCERMLDNKEIKKSIIQEKLINGKDCFINYFKIRDDTIFFILRYDRNYVKTYQGMVGLMKTKDKRLLRIDTLYTTSPLTKKKLYDVFTRTIKIYKESNDKFNECIIREFKKYNYIKIPD